jgi:hypothetical protein
MMRRERRAAPLLALLVFEVVAIIGLQAVGSSQSMQVPWSNFMTWMETSSVDELAMPLMRYAALGLAYWMLASTLLFVAAQLTRIPVAIKAAGMFTLPSVRRAVDGAMAVSIATTSVVGFAGAAVAVDGSADTSSAALAGLVTTMNSGDLTLGGGVVDPSGGDSVATPQFGAASSTTGGSTSDTTVLDLTGGSTTSTTADLVTTSTTPSTTGGGIGNTGYGSKADVIEQSSNTSEQATTSLAPSAGSDFVPTPKPGAPITTTSTVPQGPSTPTTAPAPAPAPEQAPAPATDDGTHRVVPGDNLWTISRDHIMEKTGKTKAQVTEAEIRTYWLKVIDVNRDNIRSHDPHWIFPGEIIELPVLDTASGS